MSESALQMVFVLSNLLPAPVYFLMIFVPRSKLARRVGGSVWSVAPPALLHLTFAIVVSLTQPELLGDLADIFAGGVGSDGLNALLGGMSIPAGTMSAWVHMLAGDLIMARWVYLDSLEQDLNSWLVSPTILLMYASGSIGFVLYLAVRTITAWIRSNKKTLPE